MTAIEPQAAAGSHLERLAIASWNGDPLALVHILRGCAALASASGDARHAASLLAAADTITHGSPTPVPFNDSGERTGSASCPVSAQFGTHRWNLTQREFEVLVLLGQRKTDAEIAAALSMSRRTASSHVGSIMSKLRANNRRDAVAIALGPRPQ